MSVELESQVAKIQLGPEKDAATFVYVNAEKLNPTSESFLVAEILESGKEESACQQIVFSIQAALKRAFKKSFNNETFETAVAQVNEELAKLAALGQVHWIDKLHCIIGIKIGEFFNITTTGKVVAFLVRKGELTDLSCSATKAHPLKTFENFATGKLQLNDILILSTNQLLNYLSVDRLKRLIAQDDFLKASGQAVEILKANTEGNVALGTILVRQLKAGTVPETQIDLEEFAQSTGLTSVSPLAKVWRFFWAMVLPHKKLPSEIYSKPRAISHLKSLSQIGKFLIDKIGYLFARIGKTIRTGKENLAPAQIKQFSPQKKFFFFSLLILLLAVMVQTTVALYLKNQRRLAEDTAFKIQAARTALNDADAAFLYKDEPAAKAFYLKALSFLADIKKPTNQDQQKQLQAVQSQSEAIKNRLEKVVEVKPTLLGTLAAATNLIKLPDALAVQSGSTIISWHKTQKTVRDDLLQSSKTIKLAETVDNQRAVVYDGAVLSIWNYLQNVFNEPFSTNVPAEANAVGLKYYPANQRIYMLDKNKGQIFSFAVLGDKLGRPQVNAVLKNNDGQNAVDLAVDGSIYILSNDDVKKYHAGQPADFSPLTLLTPLNGSNKILARADLANIYILDRGNRRIVILNKKGGTVNTLVAPEFTDLIDFEVDEKNKTIYLLNGMSLLKISLP